MYKALENCSFVAIDCELSGLGDRKRLNAPTIDDRYKNTALVAKTRSIISLGLSMYRLRPPEADSKSWDYDVQTYNIMVLCSEDYIVEPGSLRFLVEHGFNFQKQYSLGMAYQRGNDTESSQPLRDLFSALVLSRKSIVLHNGLIDLIFLYHNLYAALPTQLQTFVSDLTEMFPGGVYDTKYIADYVSRSQASYLEFIFRKEQRVNVDKYNKDRPHIKLSFPEDKNSEADVEWRWCGLEEEKEGSSQVCISYAHHGHCTAGADCPLSHNIDLIISKKDDEAEKKRAKKRRRKDENVENGTDEISVETDAKVQKLSEEVESNGVKTVKQPTGGHRAGYDAFMTGFAFATYLVHQTALPQDPPDFRPETICADKLVNKIYLVCKDFPLLLQKSSFAKSSVQHDAKMKKLGLLVE